MPIGNIITDAVTDALTKEAAKKSNDLTAVDAGKISEPVAAKVEAAVTKEVQAIVDNATNQEPFYQSRVTIGAAITLIGGLYGLVMDFADGTPPTMEAFTVQATAIVGALTVLYGRWVAAKPLGR